MGVVYIAPSESRLGELEGGEPKDAIATSSAAATKQASRIVLVSITQVKSLPYVPPDLRPVGPLSSCVIIFPASASDTEKTAAKLARVWGETLATNSLPSVWHPFVVAFGISPVPLLCVALVHGALNDGKVSSVVSTSVSDCNDTRTASADVTHPEQARQSVREIWAGGGGCAVAILSSVVTS